MRSVRLTVTLAKTLTLGARKEGEQFSDEAVLEELQNYWEAEFERYVDRFNFHVRVTLDTVR